MIEILKPGIGQDDGDLDFAKQTQLHRKVRVQAWRGRTGEPRDQTGGLLAAAYRVYVLDEVQLLSTQPGQQLAFLVRRQGGNQVALACLRQAEETDTHGRRRDPPQAAGQVARAVQITAEGVGLGGDFLDLSGHIGDPVQGQASAGVNGCPGVGELYLSGGQSSHFGLTLPLSSQ